MPAIVAYGWAALIFKSSSSFVSVGQLAKAVAIGGAGHISQTSFHHFWVSTWWVFVKGWHATEFGILYLLTRCALPKRTWLPVVLAAVYAVSDEAHQIFVPNRGCRASDVAIDWLGILAAWAFYRIATGGRPQRLISPTVLIVIWITAFYLLSVYPFGLVSFPGISGNPAAPSISGN